MLIIGIAGGSGSGKSTVVKKIVEGILTLANPRMRDRMDIKIFVDADADDRLMRIIQRDIQERGRSFIDVLEHYERFVKPMHLQFIEPSKRYADMIVPQGTCHLEPPQRSGGVRDPVHIRIT